MLSPLIHHVGFHQRFIFYSYLRSSSLNRHEISLQAENHVVAQVNENIQKTDAVEHQLKMFRSKKSVLEKPKLAVKNIIDYEAKRTRRNVPTTKDKSTQTDAVIIEGTEVKVLTSRSALSFSAEHSATTSTRKEKLIKENKAKKLAVEKTEASAKSSSKKQVVSVKSESVEKRIGKEIAAVSTTEPASSPKIKETVVKKDPARPSPEIKSKTLPSDSVEAKIENKISAVSTAESISSAKIDDTVVKKDSTKAPLEIKLKPVHSDGVETRTVKEIAAAPATKPSSSSGKVQTIETDVKKDAARSSPEIKSKTLPSVNVEAKIEKQITAVSTAKPTSDPKTEDTAVEKHSARASPDTKSKSVPADSVEAKIEKQIATASATKSSSYSKKAKNNGKEIKKDSARVSPERKPKPVPSELPQEATTSSSSEKSATVQTAANGRTAANGATMAMLYVKLFSYFSSSPRDSFRSRFMLFFFPVVIVSFFLAFLFYMCFYASWQGHGSDSS